MYHFAIQVVNPKTVTTKADAVHSPSTDASKDSPNLGKSEPKLTTIVMPSSFASKSLDDADANPTVMQGRPFPPTNCCPVLGSKDRPNLKSRVPVSYRLRTRSVRQSDQVD
ncbi:hypothetical protein CCHR01_04629 [Colletotrichum chrysophilum]|uniref:Uncharacterized protein n=1 Tax=Colletotrichum chrysophilum TaxID=1836956 RepID=A0AAD9ARM2_9PEZI|nr:hypothetical protein CCHR01_04629 [Colletotrichum chrysophilum]